MAQTRPDEKTESFSVKPGQCVDKRVPILAEREGKYLTQIVKVSQGSLTFRLSTRYDKPGPEGSLVDMIALPEVTNEHVVVKPIPRRQDLPGDRPAWVVATFDNSAAKGWLWNGPEALVEWHWATITASEASATELERVAFLRRIMKDGMANDLAKLFAELEWMSDDQRQGMVAHMCEDEQFLVHLEKVLDDDGITDENGKIGRAAGAEEGGKVGLVSGAALTVYGSFLFMPAVPVVAAAALAGGIVGYCGGRLLGGRVGRKAGQLSFSPEEARKEGARQGAQAVRLVAVVGFGALTAVALLRELLKRFREVMHLLKTESPAVVLQLTNLHKKWTHESTDADTKKELKKGATDAIALALKPFKMEALAPLLVTLSFFFIAQISKKSSSQTDVPHARVCDSVVAVAVVASETPSAFATRRYPRADN